MNELFQSQNPEIGKNKANIKKLKPLLNPINPNNASFIKNNNLASN